MAEFDGIQGNPKELGNNAASSASANVLTTAEYLKQQLEETRLIKDAVSTIRDVVSAPRPDISSGSNAEAISANTAAILSLKDTIESTTISIDGKGFDSNFFTALLELTLNEKKLNRMHRFATMFERSAAIMGSAQQWVPAIKAVTSAMTAAATPIASMAKSSLMFSGALALLGITMVTFLEAITFEDLFKFGLIIGTIAAVSRLAKGSGWNLAKVTVGIATLGLTIWGWNELITPKMATEFVLSTTLVMGGIALAGRLANALGGGKSFPNIIKSTIAIAAMAGSVYVFSKAMGAAKTIDLAKAAELGIVIAGYGIGFKFLGSMTGSILKGAVATAAIGGGLWVLSKGLQDLNKIDMSLSRALELSAIVVGSAAILTLIGNPVTIGFTLAGAAATAAIGGALLLLSTSMHSMSKIKISDEQATNFKNAVGMVGDVFVEFGNPLRLPLLLVGLAQAALVSGSTLVMSGAIALVSKIKIASPEKFEAFKSGAISLSDIFANFGSPWKLAKVTIGAGIATLVAASTVATALSISAFTKAVTSPSDVTRATQSLDLFIGGVETALVGREESFPAIHKGINSFMGLSNMVKEVADSAQAMGNLEFVEKEVRNGKIVIKSVRKFTPEDFGKIGSSIGLILSALTDPLAKIGGSQDKFSIGGFSITNPFSNKVQKGVKAVSNIGSVFVPLTGLLEVFAANNIDEAYVQRFNKSLGILMNGLSTNFIGLESVDNASLMKLGIGTKHLSTLIWNVSDDKFNNGVTNFERMGNTVKVIKDSINSMNLDKLTKLNDLVFNVKVAAETEALEELVKTFAIFIEELSDKLGNISNIQGDNAIEPKSAHGEPTAISSKTKSIIKKVKDEDLQEDSVSMSDIVSAIEELSTILRTETINTRNRQIA